MDSRRTRARTLVVNSEDGRGPAAVPACRSKGPSQLNSWSVRRMRRALRRRSAPRQSGATLMRMSGLRARVQNGRLTLDAPTELPEGTVLDLVVDDEGDDLDEEERAELDDAISRAWASVQAGRGRSGEEVLASLRKR